MCRQLQGQATINIILAPAKVTLRKTNNGQATFSGNPNIFGIILVRLSDIVL